MEVVLPLLWLADYINLPVALVIYVTYRFSNDITYNSIGYYKVNTQEKSSSVNL